MALPQIKFAVTATLASGDTLIESVCESCGSTAYGNGSNDLTMYILAHLRDKHLPSNDLEPMLFFRQNSGVAPS